ncbi:PIR protein [Plasmodium yoelii]|uniref:PIR protein n=2 Tax=Plasmodium yoelii TaxID=5861 RepID=A0AAF0B058_PLAYO|nr:PIR protein [Plasmodium yoelii]WBY55153.1 PIR protein [Plasmodium yoelii yoelii]CDS44567.1 YIR protein [Plasmodium yoelii]VTZ72765.1 PIR protein [Plasmodium yoelii]|eukprot:XP_022811023.1 PIR protein [Plasmodium yoelii]
MNVEVCKRFKNVWEDFPDKLDGDEKYQFNDDNFFKEYCNNKCSSYIDKINVGFLYLFDGFFKNSSVFESVAKSNINIVEYIMIWLSYMFNLKKNNSISNLNYFYCDYIDNSKYKNSIEVGAYNSYDDLINKKNYLMKMNIKDISKFYDPFKLLCEMYNEFDENKKDCTTCSEKASQFVEKYEKLYNDYNSNEESSYKEILCTLSTDYDNFKKYCDDAQCCKSSPLPTIDKTKIPAKCSEQISEQRSEVTSSSSSIASKLILVLSIFGAIAIFFGISYKYSLFGFRKRSQKQHLREKLKK